MVQYNTGIPSWATAPGETAGIDRSQLQKFKTVDQLEEEKNRSVVSRAVSSFKEGHKAGEGKDYSLEGLQAPKTRAQDMATYSLYEKSNKLSEGYNTVQNALLSRLSPGTTKDVITGVSNIPEMAIGAVGAVPLGLETIARNPTSISDSIGFGLGAMAGSTVEKAKTHPGELAGELVGAYALGKVGGSLEGKIKPGISSKGLKEFSIDERASLGAQKLVYKEQNFKSTELPKVKQEIETYHVVGDEIIPESLMKINRIQLPDDFVLTSEMEEVLFSRSSKTPEIKLDTSRLDAKLQRNIFSSELTQPTDSIISSVQAQELVIGSIKASKIESLAVEAGRFAPSPGIAVPSLAYSLPFAGQGLQVQGKQKNESIFMAASLPVIPISFSSAEAQFLPDPTLQKEKDKGSIYTTQLPDISSIESQRSKPIIIPDTLPDIPQDIPAFNDPLPPGNDPGGFTPLPFLPGRGGKKPIMLSDDFDILGESTTSKPKHRKTKKKMTKNVYGDPFNVKLKF
ncbi:hypothetical protein [Methanosarcina horonobensis]|nr:hypothetical protein [Methanosarcina horonobensis]